MGARSDLIEHIRRLLSHAGFAVSDRYTVRPISFDMVARRDDTLLVLKVLGNADALGERVAHELRVLARFLKASPLLVAERSGTGPLEDGVVYQHRGVPVITLGTLREHLVENAAPMAYASPGGLYVNLRREMLRMIRVQRSLSLGLLAQVAGVSRRAIQMYEEGMHATIDSALRLEEFLHESLVEPINPFRPFPERVAAAHEDEPSLEGMAEFESTVLTMLRDLGFRVVPTQQSPFAAVTQNPTETILTGVERKDPSDENRARILASVKSVAETDAMYVTSRDTDRVQVQGTPLVRRKELDKMRDPDELVTLLRERRKRAAEAPK